MEYSARCTVIRLGFERKPHPRAAARRSRCAPARSYVSSRAKGDDREMRVAIDIVDDEPEARVGLTASFDGSTSCDLSRGGIARSWFETRPIASERACKKDLLGPRASEALMRSMLVIPEDDGSEEVSHGIVGEGQEDAPEGFGLEGEGEPLDEGDGAVAVKGPVTGLNRPRKAPSAVIVLKVRALVGDDVLRSGAVHGNGQVEELCDLVCRGLSGEGLGTDDFPRVVVDDNGEPPREGPPLRESARAPGSPESASDRAGGEIDSPSVARVASDDGAGLGGDVGVGQHRSGSRRRARSSLGGSLGVRWVAFEETFDGTCGKVETCASEEVSDAPSTSEREGQLEAFDEMSEGVRELVDGSGERKESILPIGIDALEPSGDGSWAQDELAADAGGIPTASGLELEDGEAVRGGIVRSTAWRHGEDASPEKTILLGEERNLPRGVVELGGEPDALHGAVDGPASGVGGDEASEGDGVEDGGLHGKRPMFRQGHSGQRQARHNAAERERAVGARVQGYESYHVKSPRAGRALPPAMKPSVCEIAPEA